MLGQSQARKVWGDDVHNTCCFQQFIVWELQNKLIKDKLPKLNYTIKKIVYCLNLTVVFQNCSNKDCKLTKKVL